MRKFVGFGLIFACVFSLSCVCSAMKWDEFGAFPGSFLVGFDDMSETSSSESDTREILPFEVTFDDSEDLSDTLFDLNGNKILDSPVRVSPLTKNDPWIEMLCSEYRPKLSFISARAYENQQELDFVPIRPSLLAADDSDDDSIDLLELNLEGCSSSPDKLSEAIINIQDIIHNSSSPDLVAQAQELLRECDKLRNCHTDVPSTIRNSIHSSSNRDYILFVTDMLKSEYEEFNYGGQ